MKALLPSTSVIEQAPEPGSLHRDGWILNVQALARTAEESLERFIASKGLKKSKHWRGCQEVLFAGGKLTVGCTPSNRR